MTKIIESEARNRALVCLRSYAVYPRERANVGGVYFHTVAHDFPDELVELLEEWLFKWRRIIIEGQKGRYLHAERATNQQEFVFLNSRGRPLQLPQVTTWFERATYKFTGVAVNPHMIRHIWATEYIKSTRNFADAAYMLGDTVETVIKTYAHLLDEDCSKRANEWINDTVTQ